MYKRVLLCYEGTATDRSAQLQGSELLLLLGAEAHVLSVAPAMSFGQTAAIMAGGACTAHEAEVQRYAEQMAEQLRRRGIRAFAHVACHAIDQIPDFARQLGCDLIIIGHRSRSSLGRWWAGPDKFALAERSPCSILIAIDGTCSSN